jgi:hypothetical protein
MNDTAPKRAWESAPGAAAPKCLLDDAKQDVQHSGGDLTSWKAPTSARPCPRGKVVEQASEYATRSPRDRGRRLKKLEEEFEEAARLRDEMRRIEQLGLGPGISCNMHG